MLSKDGILTTLWLIMHMQKHDYDLNGGGGVVFFLPCPTSAAGGSNLEGLPNIT